MKALKAKLSARRGMTLTELLTAVLILALVAAGVAVGVGASLRIYRQSVLLSDAQTLSSTLSIALMDELRYARDPKPDDTYTSPTFGENVKVETDSDGHVTIGGQKLIGSGAYAGLVVEPGVYYDESTGLFEVSLKICLNEGGIAGTPLQDVAFQVRPLNE